MKTIELDWVLSVPDTVSEGEVLDALVEMAEKRGWDVLNKKLEWWQRKDGALFRDFLFALVNRGSVVARSPNGDVRISAILEVGFEFGAGDSDKTIYTGPVDGFLSKDDGWRLAPDKRVVSDFPNKIAQLIKELNSEKWK